MITIVELLRIGVINVIKRVSLFFSFFFSYIRVTTMDRKYRFM